MNRTTLFVRLSLILTLTLLSSFNLSYASDHLEDEEVQPQSFSKAMTIQSQEPRASYGNFDQLSEDILFHQILPRCDHRIIEVNRSFFTLVTGYESDRIFDQGFEHRPARKGCCIISNAMIDFKKQSNKIQQMSSFVWYRLIRKVTNIPSHYWPYFKDTQIHIVTLRCNQIDDDGVRDLGQNLKGTQIHTVDLFSNRIGDQGIRDFSQSLKSTQVHTVDLSSNQITDQGARDYGENLKGTQVHIVHLSGNQIGDKGVHDLGQSLKNTQVHTVYLTSNQITDQGAQDFGQSLQGTLVRSVSLGNNQISDNGAKNFGQSLRGTQVQSVDLSFNQIGADGALTLGQSLQITQVHTLFLHRNQKIGNEGIIALAQALKETQVKNLYLMDNEISSDTQSILKQLLPDINLIFEYNFLLNN